MKGVETCFKNINLCDQHPVCDPGEKTGEIAQDEFDCFEEYNAKNLTAKDATYQCTMVLAIENKERKICKSKWLDFTHFSTNYYFFGLYCCETANI